MEQMDSQRGAASKVGAGREKGGDFPPRITGGRRQYGQKVVLQTGVG